MNWLNRFKLWHKIALGGAAALAVMVALAYAVQLDIAKESQLVTREGQGVEFHRELRKTLGHLQVYRTAAMAVLQGDANAKPTAEQAKTEFAASLAALETVNEKYASVLKAHDRFKALKEKLTELFEPKPGIAPEVYYEAGKAAGAELLALGEHVTRTSELLLTPDALTFLVLEASIRLEPPASEEIALAQNYALMLIRKASANQDELAQLTELYGLVQARGRAAGQALDAVMEFSATVKEKFEGDSKKPYVAVRRWGNTVNDMAAGQSLADVNAKSFLTRSNEAIQARRVLFDGLMDVLSETLDAQQAELTRKKLLVIGAAGSAILFVALFFLLIVADATRRLRRAEAAAAAMVAGDFSSEIDAAGSDEVAKVLRAFLGVKDRLRTTIAAQSEMAQAHARGDSDHRIDASALPGEYAALAERSNTLVEQHIAANLQLLEVIDRYGRGDFSVDMPELPGQQRRITEAAVRVKTNLLAVAEEIDRLAGAAARGDFSVRGDATAYQAKFQEMVHTLNRLMEVTRDGLDDVRGLFGGLAEGDLTHRMSNQYEGVFAQLRDDANLTMTQLTGLIAGIRGSADSINAAGADIANGNADLSRRTEEQAVSIEQATSSLREFSSSVQQNASNAQQASELAASASKTAARGGEIVREVVTTMDAIASSSKRVQDIISVIDGIAFQTNILALNAAVEAARAGEQGKGFAVVASEVRNLAQRSASAAKEIKSLIVESVERVDSGAALVGQAGVQMEEIVAGVQRVTDIVTEIAAASGEQASGIEQVSNAMLKMDEVTKQNAALVEESAAAAEQLREQAAGLVGSVGAFRLDDGESVESVSSPRLRAAA